METLTRQQQDNDQIIDEMKADFRQEQRGELMALDIIKSHNTEVFESELREQGKEAIHSQGDVREAEIAAVQASQFSGRISEDIAGGNNTPETRKHSIAFDSFAQEIGSMVENIVSSAKISELLDVLDDLTRKVLAYDLPEGYEKYQKEALDHLFKAQEYALVEHSAFNADDVDHRYRAKEIMRYIETEIERLWQIENNADFGNMCSDEIEVYAETVINNANDKSLNGTLSDKDYQRALAKYEQATIQAGIVRGQEEAEARHDEEDFQDFIINQSDMTLTQTQNEMCGYLAENYPLVQKNLVAAIYGMTPEDYDRVDENIARFSDYMEQNKAEDQERAFKFLFMEGDEPAQASDCRDLTEDFPQIESNVISKIYALSPGDIDRVQDNIQDFLFYLEERKSGDQATLFEAFFNGQKPVKSFSSNIVLWIEKGVRKLKRVS